MIFKSYFAGSREAALQLGRQELGPDAVFVESRKSAPQQEHLGKYEAVFAVPMTNPSLMAEAGAKAATPEDQVEPLVGEVSELRRQMERMAGAITAFDRFILAGLTANEVVPELALAITRCLGARVASDPVANAVKVVAEIRHEQGIPCPPAMGTAVGFGRMKQALMDELGSLFTVSSELGKPGSGPKVAALVGPPGVGKTTTLVKLAVTYGLMKRKATQLVAVGARGNVTADQLRTYAVILGAGFQALETGADLPRALEENAGKDLILIDTPGFGAKDFQSASHLAAVLQAHPEIDVHLVIACIMKPADVARVVDRFEIFRPSKLLFTKLDETEFYGSILNEAVRKRRPVSFLAAGQRIPEDLEAPSKERIVDLVLRGY